MQISRVFKKAAAALVAAMLVCGMAVGCSSGGSGDVITLRLWGSQEDQVMLGEMVESFKASQPGKNFEIILSVVGENDLKSRYLEDPEAAADVFAFPNDQLYDLVNAGALYEITLNKAAIIAANGPGSVEAASVGNSLYAYPMTADNGYFLFYDRSVISDEQAKTLDGILAAADAAGKRVFMDLANGWYIVSFFFGAGCTMHLSEDGRQILDFNSPAGVRAGEAIRAFAAHPAYVSGDDAVLTGGMGDMIAAGVSGIWNESAIRGKLGNNFAATKLPTFTSNGEQLQMGSFGGYKLVGVNSLTQNPLEAMALAEWITNEANQIKRFEMRTLGPSNLVAASDSRVLANEALAALAMQSQYATSQKDVAGGYWAPAGAFGTTMVAKDNSKTIQELLDEMVAQIQN
ncbi:MAG: extracellular solute-binding protein [Defluviitaleaceae bacterium]|nr:extracellular solute-binding protein [Defluviitaleaceae bacterium]